MHLQGWLSFYRTVERVKDRVVIAPFEDVIDDFGLIIDRVNSRFGTEFDQFEHTTANVEAVRSSRGYHALPSEQRSALKQQARERFMADVGTEHDLVTATRSLYDRFVAKADLPENNRMTTQNQA
jgi:hypothetical protein